MEKFILASGSPRRKELLEQIGLEFNIIVSNSDEETVDKKLPPDIYTSELAMAKAAAVAKKLTDEGRKKEVIIAADTVVVINGELLGKPKNKADAEGMLKMLSGKSHEVYTGICVMRLSDGLTFGKSEKTIVSFKDLSDDMIKNYIDSNEPMDKAGAYGIQGLGSVLVDKIDGDWFNVVGLPLSALYDILKNEFDIDILNRSRI